MSSLHRSVSLTDVKLVLADQPSRSQFMVERLFSSAENSLEDLLSAANRKHGHKFNGAGTLINIGLQYLHLKQR